MFRKGMRDKRTCKHREGEGERDWKWKWKWESAEKNGRSRRLKEGRKDSIVDCEIDRILYILYHLFFWGCPFFLVVLLHVCAYLYVRANVIAIGNSKHKKKISRSPKWKCYVQCFVKLAGWERKTKRQNGRLYSKSFSKTRQTHDQIPTTHIHTCAHTFIHLICHKNGYTHKYLNAHLHICVYVYQCRHGQNFYIHIPFTQK